MKRLRETTKNLREDSRSSGPDLIPEPPECNYTVAVFGPLRIEFGTPSSYGCLRHYDFCPNLVNSPIIPGYNGPTNDYLSRLGLDEATRSQNTEQHYHSHRQNQESLRRC
jgi:hypothetical protein